MTSDLCLHPRRRRAQAPRANPGDDAPRLTVQSPFRTVVAPPRGLRRQDRRRSAANPGTVARSTATTNADAGSGWVPSRSLQRLPHDAENLKGGGKQHGPLERAMQERPTLPWRADGEGEPELRQPEVRKTVLCTCQSYWRARSPAIRLTKRSVPRRRRSAAVARRREQTVRGTATVGASPPGPAARHRTQRRARHG